MAEVLTESTRGKLTMWDRYGKGRGVALVLKTDPFFNGRAGFRLFTSPVAYFQPGEFEMEIERLNSRISNHVSVFKKLPVDTLLQAFAAMFFFSAMSIKDADFADEKEWRLIYAPDFAPSKFVNRETLQIDGVNQEICKIPLRARIDDELVGTDLVDLIERVIIGPMKGQEAVRKKFISLLEDAGVQEARLKVYISETPIRVS